MITNWCLVPGAEPFASRAARGVVWTTVLGIARATARLWYQRARALEEAGTAKRAGKGRRAPAKPRGVDVLVAALAAFEGRQGKELVP